MTSIVPLCRTNDVALCGLLKKSGKQIPRRLKPPRNAEMKGLIGTRELVPFPKHSPRRVFPQPVKACSDANHSPALPHALYERDLIDLLERGQANSHLIQGGLAQEPHAFFAGGAAYFRGRLLGQDHLADAVAQVQHFVNRAPSPEPRTRALDAALTLVEGNFRPLLRIESAGFEHFWRIMHNGTAGITDQPHQALG